MRNPIVETISPPATRTPGTEMPKKSMIADPSSRNTARMAKA